MSARFNIKGRLRVGIVDSNVRGRYVAVEITDDSAGVKFLTAELTLEQFAQVIVGRSEVDVDLELRLGKVGTKREHKQELVPFCCYRASEEAMSAALAPFEVDGWSGRRSDLTNGHNRVGREDVQRVTFERWVTP